jgi:hypothetical protein
MRLEIPSDRWCVVERVTSCSARAIQREMFLPDQLRSERFSLQGTPAPARDQTVFHACTDGKELLIVVAVIDSAAPTTRLHQEEMPNRHSIEIFFAPWNDELGWFQFCFQPDGSVQSFNHLPYAAAHSTSMRRMEVKRFEWETEMRHALGRVYWLTARFDLKDVFRDGDVCGFNIARYSPPIEETSAWNHVSAVGFQDATTFGKLSLRKPRKGEIKSIHIRPATRKQARDFKFSITYDIPDNIGYSGHYTPARIHRELSMWKSYGANRVNWIEYGPISGWPSLYSPAFWQISGPWKKQFLQRVADTKRYCDDTLRAAAKSAKRLGMEIFAVFKPFDLGFNAAEAENDGRSCVMDVENRWKCAHPDIAAHPEFTMRAHPDWLRRAVFPIRRLSLWSEKPIESFDASQLSIWTSSDNRHFTKYRGLMRVRTEMVQRPHQRWTPAGKIVEKSRAKNWRIELSDLEIAAPFVSIQIADKTFELTHRMFAFAEAIGADGSEAPIELATAGNRENGFTFSKTWPGWANHTEPIVDTFTWRGPELGLRFGDAENITTMFEPMFAGAREIWLKHVKQFFDAGVDGVDIRTIGHHNGNEGYLKFAFAQPVREEFRRRFRRDVEATEADYERVRHLRGEAYTQFMRDAGALAHARGKKLAAHVEWGTDVPANLHTRLQMQMKLDWQRWIRDGIVDEISLRGWGPLNRHVQRNILPLARRHGVGVHIISRCLPGGIDLRAMELCPRFVTEACAAGMAGFSLYESNDLMRLNGDGEPMPVGLVDEAVRAARGALDNMM